MTASTNLVFPPYNAIVSTAGTISIGAGGGSGGVYGYPTLGTAATSTWPISWTPVSPNEQLLNDSTVMDALIGRIVTKADANKTLIVCVDNDCSQEVVDEIGGRLADMGIAATVIRGARAGYGASMGSFNVRAEDKRVDILARIGELWEQRPDLKLTELFQWYAGAHMEDDDFVKCTEVHFKKLTEG